MKDYESPPQDLLGRPVVVGVVNMTEDSFSDGGLYLTPGDALAQARNLLDAGAELVELGPAASHPGAVAVSSEQERDRLTGVLDVLVEAGVAVSVDSFQPDTQRFAIAAGAAMLNDIHGFVHPGLYPELAAGECALVVMHSVNPRGVARAVETDPRRVWAEVDRFFTRRLEALDRAGIGAERVIIDPGLGFFLGANPEPSLRVMAGLHHLKARFGRPVMISPSRKSFLRAVTGRPIEAIGSATLAAEIYAAFQGVDYIRTHDVGSLVDALAVLHAIADQGRVMATGADPKRSQMTRMGELP